MNKINSTQRLSFWRLRINVHVSLYKLPKLDEPKNNLIYSILSEKQFLDNYNLSKFDIQM